MVPLLFTVLVTERFPSPSKVANPTPRTGVPLGTFVPSLQSAYLPSKLALEHPSPPIQVRPSSRSRRDAGHQAQSKQAGNADHGNEQSQSSFHDRPPYLLFRERWIICADPLFLSFSKNANGTTIPSENLLGGAPGGYVMNQRTCADERKLLQQLTRDSVADLRVKGWRLV